MAASPGLCPRGPPAIVPRPPVDAEVLCRQWWPCLDEWFFVLLPGVATILCWAKIGRSHGARNLVRLHATIACVCPSEWRAGEVAEHAAATKDEAKKQAHDPVCPSGYQLLNQMLLAGLFLRIRPPAWTTRRSLDRSQAVQSPALVWLPPTHPSFDLFSSSLRS